MRICILCEDSKVDLARENGKSLSDNTTENKSTLHPKLVQIKETLKISEGSAHLRIPLSESGNLPATYWFCFMNTTEDGYSKLLTVQEHSIIEENNPKEFLEKWNLKIIR
jgi:hypothetical protein